MLSNVRASEPSEAFLEMVGDMLGSKGLDTTNRIKFGNCMLQALPRRIQVLALVFYKFITRGRFKLVSCKRISKSSGSGVWILIKTMSAVQAITVVFYFQPHYLSSSFIYVKFCCFNGVIRMIQFSYVKPLYFCTVLTSICRSWFLLATSDSSSSLKDQVSVRKCTLNSPWKSCLGFQTVLMRCI